MGALIDWMLLPLKRYAEFGGRSSRREFWSFFLLNLAVTMVLLGPLYIRMIAGLTGSRSGNGAGPPPEPGALAMGLGLVGGLWALGTLVPIIALSVRRLHDRGLSGLWYLGFLVAAAVVLRASVPFAGFIVTAAYLALMSLGGTPGPNRYGPAAGGARSQTV